MGFQRFIDPTARVWIACMALLYFVTIAAWNVQRPPRRLDKAALVSTLYAAVTSASIGAVALPFNLNIVWAHRFFA